MLETLQYWSYVALPVPFFLPLVPHHIVLGFGATRAQVIPQGLQVYSGWRPRSQWTPDVRLISKRTHPSDYDQI